MKQDRMDATPRHSRDDLSERALLLAAVAKLQRLQSWPPDVLEICRAIRATFAGSSASSVNSPSRVYPIFPSGNVTLKKPSP